MEEDMEVGLVQQFSCLGTTDKDVLVAQLQRIVGPSLNPSAAHFFLDMNNWNLQLAVGAYFDLTEDVSPSEPAPVSGTTSTYSMSLVDERSAGEEPTVTPSTKFVRTWRIRNSGAESWPPGSFLRFKTGHIMGASERIYFHPANLKAGEEAEVSVEFLSPCEVGAFDSRWQMSTPMGFLFGDEIWVIVTVGPDLTLDIASRLRTLTCQPPDS